MKLKKIASLALAGIMAVSMLTACGEGGSSSSEPTTPVTPTTGVADGANSVASDYGKSLNLVYNEDSDLLTALTKAAADCYKSKDIEDAVTNKGYEGVKDSAKNSDIVAKISKSLAGTETAIGTDYTIFKNIASEGTKKYAVVYTIGGNFDIDQAGAMVAQYLNGTKAGGVVNNTNMPSANGTAQLKADYSADIAAVKLTSNDSSSKSIWVVTVLFTQTVTSAKA